MKDARIFNCGLCHSLVTICSCCDRGNIYCGEVCATQARSESSRLANKRYQNTYQGKLNHAARQKRYIARLKLAEQKVTHHSIQPPYNILLRILIAVAMQKIVLLRKNGEICCNFCGKPCSAFVRQGFLRSGATVKIRAGP